ncbi:MAG: hypothetical protein KDD11_19400, partial [Acidobacteria bacterium]|nr:hypothetical protein [Acidobacteriota bacterium]
MSPGSTVAAIVGHARRSPEQPWLFYRPELDWRWRSWRQVAAQLAAGPRPAGNTARPPAAGAVLYPSFAHPDVLAFDLAVSAAGLSAVPLAPETWPPSAELVAHVGATALGRLGHGLVGLPKRAADPVVASLPRLEPAPAPGTFESVDLAAADPGPAGDVWVGAPDVPRRLSQDELLAAVEHHLGPLPSADRRDVLVVGRSLAEPYQRLLATWAALTGAALVLDPEAARTPAIETVRWVRPTLLHGTAAELGELHRRLDPRLRRGSLSRRWLSLLKPPCDRVRALLVLGPEPLAPAVEEFWRGVGAAVLHLATSPFDPGPFD